MTDVRVRIAPSPTGSPHLATAYQAIFNKAFAQKHRGAFILRIEDTDRQRFVPESEKEIFEYLNWLGLNWDEGPDTGGSFGPYRQSERLELYKTHAEQLVENNHAYYCFCSPERLEKVRKQQQQTGKPPRYDRHCRNIDPDNGVERVRAGEAHTIRLKVPQEGETDFTDLIRGEITIRNESVDDQVLLKSDGYPTYHLAVVVDDHLMKISHIIRSEEWISSVPKHIMIYQAFDWPIPVFAHTPLIRDEQGRKMGKRHGSTSIQWFKQNGFVPEAINNYLALLGWSHPNEKDIFSFDEFARVFTLERIQPSAPVFDIDKLEWMNGRYIRELPDEKLAMYLKDFAPECMDDELLRAVLPLVTERIKRLTEFEDMTKFLVEDVEPDKEELTAKKLAPKDAVEILKKIHFALEKINDKDFHHENVEKAIREAIKADGHHKGSSFMTIRIAVTGRKVTPPLFESIELLGKEKTLKRLQNAVELLG